MTVNGQVYPHEQGLTLHALMAKLDVDGRKVVVMRGEDIFRAGKIPDVALAPQDVIEIVTMMQGG